MKAYLNCVGKNILENKSGKKLAKILDIIFDTNTGKIEGVINNDFQVLLFSDILSWKNNLYIKSDLLFHDQNNTPHIQSILNQKISILGNRIINEDSKLLGYCQDIIFDEKNGIILKLLSQKYFLDIIPTKKFLIDFSEIIIIKKRHILVKSTAIKDAVPEV